MGMGYLTLVLRAHGSGRTLQRNRTPRRGEIATRLQRQSPLIFGPIDDLEKHPSVQHFSLQICCVLFPIAGLPNTKARLIAGSPLSVIRFQRSANTFIHHRQTVVRERSIIHT